MGQHLPLISVIMPAYNCEDYVREAINCVLNQSYGNIELIIANDCSTDKTQQVIDSVHDARIRKFTNETNLGYLKTWNKHVPLATGSFITFLDADDSCALNRIELLYKAFAEDTELGICGSNYIRINDAGAESLRSDFKLDHDAVFDAMPDKYEFIGSAVMIRREVIERVGLYHEFFDRIGSEDHYWLYLAIEKFKYRNLKEHLYFYRFNENSVMGNLASNPSKLHSGQIVKLLIEQRRETGSDYLQQGKDAELKGILDEMNRPFLDNAYFHWFVGRQRFYEGKHIQGLRLLRKAIIKAPWRLNYYRDYLYFFRASNK